MKKFIHNSRIDSKLALLISIVFTILLFSGCSSKSITTISGTVESTKFEIASEVAGKIVVVQKSEGDKVKKDDVIASIDDSLQELNVKQLKQVVELKQIKLDDLKAARPEKIKQAEDAVAVAKAKLSEIKTGTRTEQINQAKAAVQIAEANMKSAETNYNYMKKKYESAKDIKAIEASALDDAKLKLDTSFQQFQVAKEQYYSASQQLELLKKGATQQTIDVAQATYNQAVSQLTLLQKDYSSESIKIAKADLEQSKIALEQADLVLEKYNIKSTSEGTLISTNFNVGDMVNTGANISTISDLDNLYVVAYVTQSNLGNIKLNNEIDLELSALPNQIVKGRVIFVSDEAEFTPKNTETDDSKENTVFKFKVKILEKVSEIKPGMTAKIVLK